MTTIVPEVAPDVAPEASVASIPPAVREPDPWVQLAAMLTLPFEVGAFLATWPALATLSGGDEHPVLVMPGFMGDDTSTIPLRTLIGSWGHRVYGWGGRVNPGPTPDVLSALDRRLAFLCEKHGCKLSLVGWSAGGRYARHLARAHPDMVRQVIVLAGGLQHRIGFDRTSIQVIIDQVRHGWSPDFGTSLESTLGPLPVPSTSIYSRTDGLVRWHSCLDVVDATHENVEVFASHVGVGINPSVFYVIADRLAQPEHDWQPFRAPPWLGGLYPRSPSWQPRNGPPPAVPVPGSSASFDNPAALDP